MGSLHVVTMLLDGIVHPADDLLPLMFKPLAHSYHTALLLSEVRQLRLQLHDFIVLDPALVCRLKENLLHSAG